MKMASPMSKFVSCLLLSLVAGSESFQIPSVPSAGATRKNQLFVPTSIRSTHQNPTNADETPTTNEKSDTPVPNERPYSELKMNGPPLYSQGHLTTQLEYGSSDTNPPLDASRTALLIVDVQPEYWSECPAVREDFEHFPSRISSLVQHCRDQQSSCIWVRADYSFDKSPWLEQFTRIHEGRIPPVVKPNSKWEDFATPAPGEFVMTKTSWSSTTNTQLVGKLKADGIDTVLVCGLITSVCVQHSAFGIFEAGFRTILVTDACADRGKARHDAALALYGDYMYELQTVDSVKQDLYRSWDLSLLVKESMLKNPTSKVAGGVGSDYQVAGL